MVSNMLVRYEVQNDGYNEVGAAEMVPMEEEVQMGMVVVVVVMVMMVEKSVDSDAIGFVDLAFENMSNNNVPCHHKEHIYIYSP